MGNRNVDYSVLERILSGNEGPRHLPFEILTSITDNFSENRKIGSGGFSHVYKGVFHDWTVAVKKITLHSNNIDCDDKLFRREVESLLKIIEHPNVVRFLGFHSSTHHEANERRLVEIRERLLCFEYISNGSLEKYITDELRGLEWNIRYQIIKGICEGLQYLHNKLNIIHMDLKPANIMVDTDMLPKITDFGLARLDENKSTKGARFGSRGYCAPEYINFGMISRNCDIYSLGVVINKIVTGRKKIPNKDRVIPRWRWRKSDTYTEVQVQQITKCIEIAERCTQKEPENRPSILDIICILNESADNQNKKIKLSSWDYDDDMLGIEPLELRFAFQFNNMEISNAVELTNETSNCIAFKIKTVSQLKYCTQPNKGIALPGSNNTVKITLQAQETTERQSMPRGDRFIVQSTKVQYGLTDEEITEDMFNDEAGEVVDEVNVMVVYYKPEKQQDGQSVEVNALVSKEDACSSYKDVRLNFRPIETTSATNVSSKYKANERAAVDIMTGAMGGLLPKLGKLLNGDHNLPEDVMEDVESLQEQLMDMHTALCIVPHEEMHMLDLQQKRWANKVKNLSYDIDDMVDGLLISIEGTEPITNLDGIRSLVHKMLRRVRDVANKEVKLTTSVASNNRHVRSTDVDPRILDWYKDHKYLVGIKGPRESLVEKLTGGDDQASEQKLMIISIFGEGGLGKTTLAKEVFDKLAANFALKAFVPVGRNLDIRQVLKNILFELDKKGNKHNHNAEREEISHLIDDLQNLLRSKRYFIVIDDIWDINSWEIIKCALIDNCNGSRVMTTSRIHNVAKSCGEVCKLEPLSASESKELFYSRLTHKGICTVDQLDEMSEYILGKCGGLPLAIITIAGLLNGKRVEDWPKVYNSIKFGHEDNKAENTKKILLFSYFDLPCHLKTCLLYVSIYPEDCVIEKNTLLRKWIAEGFVRQEKGKTLFEVGESYFNELINRSIIQPLDFFHPGWSGDRIETGTICACHIHDMVLDLICSIAKEESFVTVLDDDEQNLSSQNNARILAVHKGSLEQHDLAYTCKQQVRSFIIARDDCDLSLMGLDSLLPSFQVLRVLSLENCERVSGDDAYCLKNIAQLRHLRYLSLAGTTIPELPMEIGDLRYLQTLDLTETEIEELPQSVTLLRELKRLLCFSYNQPVKLPDGMGSLTSLEELRLSLEFEVRLYGHSSADSDNSSEVGSRSRLHAQFHSGYSCISDASITDQHSRINLTLDSDNSSDSDDSTDSIEEQNRLELSMEKMNRLTELAGFVEELGKLTELRVLQIMTVGFSGSLSKALVESVNKLKKMEELEVCQLKDNISETPTNRLDDYSPCNVPLRRLGLYSTEMPVWIDASLGNIFYLELHLTSFTERDLGHLGSLRELRSLHLTCYDAFHGVVVAAAADAFPKLRYLKTNCSLTYVQEAMQCLEHLNLIFTVRVELNFDSLQCLRSLEKLSCGMWHEVWTDTEIEAALPSLRRAVEYHPNRPILCI